MTTINFLPGFTVDFRQYSAADKAQEDVKVKDIALDVLKLIPLLFTSFVQALYTTMSYSVISFKQIVLGYYGSMSNFRPPADIYLAVFKVGFWILSLAWCTVTTTGRLFMQKISPSTSDFLYHFTKGEIDIRHIRTTERGIDVSQVEARVKVDDLAQIFEGINFTDPNAPGYMKDSSRQEYTTVYTVKQLKDSLGLFIKQVNGRVAFLGTPPAYDTPRLMAFYQQIENAVRYSIDKSNKEIAEFKQTNGDGPYDDVQSRKLKNLMEDRARIAIDLAIAGLHCGARYMGEAMNVYGNIRGEVTDHKGTLEECIVELLARKRYEIAARQIQKYLGTDTHAYNKYMANLGAVLGLPGTENIIEHLDTSFDRQKFLKLFFQDYTVDFIIATIQAEIKKSQSFREKITDWIPAQADVWKKEEYARGAEALVPRVEAALAEPVDESDFYIWKIESLIAYLKSTGQNVKLQGTWDNMIQGLFNEAAVKQWRDTEFASLAVEQRMQGMNKLKMLCSSLAPSEEALKKMSREEILEILVQNSRQQSKINKVRVIVKLKPETVARMMEGKVGIKEAIADKFDQDRRIEFFEEFPLTDERLQAEFLQKFPTLDEPTQRALLKAHFGLERNDALREDRPGEFIQNFEATPEYLDGYRFDQIVAQGISPALMEWVLVSQKILLSQVRG